MAQKQMQRSASAPGASAGAGNGHLSPEAAERVRELIAGRHSKAALQLAKDLHKREATAESENLLVDAYRARIEDLIQLRMTVEAKALFAIVCERFPVVVPQLAKIEQELCVLDGRLDGIVGPLRDPDLAPEERERIESFVRQRIDDLPALAAVRSLPSEHPLRSAASALAAAFQAVTEGPVDDELLALPQVSRRSPLAPWKALVRAIACYYRHEDAECKKWLGAIAGDSMPARLIPSMTAMLGEKAGVSFSPAESRLIEAAGDRGAALRSSLAVLEAAVAEKKKQPILDAVRAFSVAGIGVDAALRERLRQHIAVRCIMQHIPRQAADGALGGPPRLDAYFYRLLARSLEDAGYAESSAEAVIVWEEFRREAIRENWLVAGGLEDGVLSLHMAEMVAKLPADVVAEMEDGETEFCDAGKSRKSTRLPSAEMLYERACQADASAEAFEAWLRWAKRQQDGKRADDVAERWRKARRGEIPPLLHLMESAEKRNALKKSLKYLEEAEELDRLNPAVRRAKARLLLSAALRHLRERKTRLVPAEIERLLAVPDVRPGEVSALALALRWCSAAVDGDKATREEHERKLAGAVGPVAAHLLLSALSRAAQWPANVSVPPFDARRTPPAELLAGAVQACLLGDWVGLSIPLVFGWTGKLIEGLHQPNGSADAAQLLVLGEAALGDSARELAYTVSAAGLALGNANARFLFLRARAVPIWMGTRPEGCLRAALELARRERDTELAGKILDRLGGRFGRDMETDSLSSELLSGILEEELKLKKFPTTPRDDQPRYAAQLASMTAAECDCPKCRAKRGEPVDDWDDEDDEDMWDEEDEDLDDPPLKGIPGVLAAVVAVLPSSERQRILKAIEAGEDPLKVLDTIDKAVRKLSPGRGGRASGWKPPKPVASSNDKNRKKNAPDQQPVQGSLF
ncbi:MAG: tetratricopeptide repeat protein [Terracidiphilus sp.]